MYKVKSTCAGCSKTFEVESEDRESGEKEVLKLIWTHNHDCKEETATDKVDDLLNQICYELSDLGFHSREYDEVKVEPLELYLGERGENSVIFIQKYTEWDTLTRKFKIFYFNEIKDAVYRLKDVIGIDKIDTINFLRPEHTNYEILSLSSFRLECIDDFELISMFIVFNY